MTEKRKAAPIGAGIRSLISVERDDAFAPCIIHTVFMEATIPGEDTPRQIEVEIEQTAFEHSLAGTEGGHAGLTMYRPLADTGAVAWAAREHLLAHLPDGAIIIDDAPAPQ